MFIVDFSVCNVDAKFDNNATREGMLSSMIATMKTKYLRLNEPLNSENYGEQYPTGCVTLSTDSHSERVSLDRRKTASRARQSRRREIKTNCPPSGSSRRTNFGNYRVRRAVTDHPHQSDDKIGRSLIVGKTAPT